MSISHSLFIKYGLEYGPTEKDVEKWLQLVDELVSQGFGKEEAGDEAAKQIFPDYQTMSYASQADTIEALLSAARDRR